MNRKETLELLKDIIDEMTEIEFMNLQGLTLRANSRIARGKIEEANNTIKENKLNKTIIAYVDGSFDKDKKLCGSGVVFLNSISDDKPITTIDFATEDKYNMWNIQGECEACIKAIEVAIDKGCSEIHIYHDYQGISSWVIKKGDDKREWKAKNEYTQGYVKRFDELSKKIKVKFVKVKGHSKDKWNDEADKLARRSLGK
ncbi:reverse transcriptase-like protein [Clostridium perfringens]|uniref:RNase H family protein n=1 Tax=Clostridium perfringens TaxID=1502 RepID=UPI001F06D8F8|nr:RNase H family protein [Clostridium perfringens]MCH1964364.1 reverse transcriptase-like protein [Clostridium perfringens]